jgi:hypothetical protein
MVGTFRYVVWRDRSWPFSPKAVRSGTTALDLDDPRSLNEAIAAAAWHDRGDDANMDLYRMNVFALDGTPIIRNYRWSEWLDSTDDGSYDTEP